MIAEGGHFALAMAVALAFAQGILPLVGAARRDSALLRSAPALAVGHMIALALAFAALVWVNVVNDFSVLNVAENGNSLKPMLYRVTGTWGSHEGSVLLWCTILGLCGASVAVFGRSLPTMLRARVIGVLGLTACGFELFALLASNPFLRIWPPPADGHDLNPLLQDPGLAFHPPMLYLGYVGFAVPFAFAVAALLEGRVDAAWGRWVRPWTLAAWACLSCGIALGSFWSYYVLGWGGFWAWDPVENASLLPWLTGTALLHSAIVVEKREGLKIWTVLLAISTFSLSLSGTFFVRSGLLNSVHAFANDPTRGVFILVLLALTIGGSLLLFAWRAPALAAGGVFAPLSREGALVLNNVLLCAIAAVVFTGTVYPLFAQLVFNQTLSVGPPFFNAAVLPLVIPLFGAMAIGPMLPWKRARLGTALMRLWWAALAALAAIAVGWYQGAGLAALGFGAAAWLILGAMVDFGGRLGLPRTPLRHIPGRARHLPGAAWGAALGHIGMGLTVLGISASALSSYRLVWLAPGQSTTIGGYQWRLDGVTSGRGPNYTARIATVVVSRGGHPVVTLHPARRSFPVQGITTTEARLDPSPLRTLYAVLGEERNGGAVLRLRVDVLAIWIWLGAAIMALGGAISIADRRLRVGAPARRGAATPGTVRA